MCLGMFDCSAWMSLLGLLNPLEYFVTVNHSALWQKHVAWAKPDGAELRNYITSRYSTNMVLLSLILAAEINVFFNPSRELTELRAMLADTKYATLSIKFWIGHLLLLDIYVTLMGLVATFTLWGMISSISDRNAHCLLRSSIGQYVISLPPRLVVASLYLFLLWSMMFIIDLVASPLSWIIVGLVSVMFFCIVIPLSAFGRLILHTGAMAQKPILVDSLEQELLPSGLQASLLLRATHRQRRYTCVTAQYHTSHRRRDTIASASHEQNDSMPASRLIPSGSAEGPTSTTTNGDGDGDGDEDGTRENQVFSIQEEDLLSTSRIQPKPAVTSRHNRLCSVDTFVEYPQPSVLNSTISRRELNNLIEDFLSNDYLLQQQEHEVKNIEGGIIPIESNTNNEIPQTPKQVARPTVTGRFPSPHPTSRVTSKPKHHRRASSTRVLMEWAEETDVREMYGAQPPAELPREILTSPQWWGSSQLLSSSFSLDYDNSSSPAAAGVAFHSQPDNGNSIENLRQPLLHKNNDSTLEHEELNGE